MADMKKDQAPTNKQVGRFAVPVVIIVIFLAISVWWLFVDPLHSDALVDAKHAWSSTYGVLSLVGGIIGLTISRRWGGHRSVLGRALIAFSIGLLLQTFGQVVYNYYTLVAHLEAPYPSLGDVGYFGSIPAYVYGVVLLGKAAGARISLKQFHNQILAVLLPLGLLTLSYFIFLNGYTFDWSSPLTIFLDFGYPLGQAVYVSLALLILIVSIRLLGGVMKKPLTLLLIALVVQYVCDFNFLYQANQSAWYAGGPGDYLYAISYLLMTLSLIYTGIVFRRIRESN